MKREFLQNFKIGDQTLTKEIIDAIMNENGNDIEAARKPFSDYESIKQQLSDANKTIEDFKNMDVDGIKKAADEWKAKFEQAEKDHAAKLADMEFDSLLSGAVSTAKGKNAKAIRALLDVDALKASKNQSDDIKAALEALKKDSGYLFEDDKTPPPYAPGPGKTQVINQDSTSSLAGALRERYAMKG